MVMVDNTNNEIDYIQPNPFNHEQTLRMRVKQEDEDSEPLVIDLLDSSGDEISADELEEMGEKEGGEGKQELLGMPEDKDDSPLGIMGITNNVPPRNSASHTVKQKVQDVEI